MAGSAGTGKTTMGVQFLYNGAVRFGEPGVMVLLNDRADNLKTYMLRFGWDLGALERKGQLSLIEMSPVPLPSSPPQGFGPEQERGLEAGIRGKTGLFEDLLPFSPETIMQMVDEKIEKIDAKRLVFDSLTDLMMRHADVFRVRLDLLLLMRYLQERKLTSLLISEVSKEGEADRFGVESFLVGGLILLRSIAVRDETLNFMEIVKMRGTEHSKKKVAYRITSKGIALMPSIRFA